MLERVVREDTPCSPSEKRSVRLHLEQHPLQRRGVGVRTIDVVFVLCKYSTGVLHKETSSRGSQILFPTRFIALRDSLVH
jgi:hypothetical protein